MDVFVSFRINYACHAAADGAGSQLQSARFLRSLAQSIEYIQRMDTRTDALYQRTRGDAGQVIVKVCVCCIYIALRVTSRFIACTPLSVLTPRSLPSPAAFPAPSSLTAPRPCCAAQRWRADGIRISSRAVRAGRVVDLSDELLRRLALPTPRFDVERQMSGVHRLSHQLILVLLPLGRLLRQLTRPARCRRQVGVGVSVTVTPHR